jgi:hypothetical protein
MICSADCFSVMEFSLKESYDCQKNCAKGLEIIDSKTQIAFGKFDSVLNGCLHSCSKQKRKSPLLSSDSVVCYRECLSLARNTLKGLENHLLSTYSQFIN